MRRAHRRSPEASAALSVERSQGSTFHHASETVSPVVLLLRVHRQHRCQVGGRDLALFSVVTAFPPVRDNPWVLVMFSAWAASEVIRYGTTEAAPLDSS